MKIQFIKPHTDAFGKTYQSGWVADWSQPDAERAILDGFAIIAPLGAYPRKQAAPVLECAAPPEIGQTYTADEIKEFENKLGAPFKRAGEIELEDLPEAAKQESRLREGGFFKKK